METRDNDRAEVISESHLQFMRDYVAREEKLARASVDRFLERAKAPAWRPSDLKQIKMPHNRS
jgi:hypothetical protein